MANATARLWTFPPLYVRRLAGAMLLDSSTYEDVEADRRATVWAALTVLIASVGEGVALRGQGGLANVALMSAVALMGWAAWALLTFEVGARLMPGARTHSDVGELLRTLGFAAAPGVVAYLSLVPGLMMPVLLISRAWMLLAMIVAVRQALDYKTTGRAVGVCVAGWALSLVVAVVIGLIFAPTVT